MLKLLTLLLDILERLLAARHDSGRVEEGRKDVQEVLDANVAKAAEVAATPDAARDERLRNRFDEAEGGRG